MKRGSLGPGRGSQALIGLKTLSTDCLRARARLTSGAPANREAVRSFDTAKNLPLTLRGLDRFCTGIMEGEKRAGEEVVSDFLISLAAGYSALPEAFAETLGLYIKLSYGDNNTRVIPFELGRKVALFSGETTLLTNEAGARRRISEAYLRGNINMRIGSISILRGKAPVRAARG